MWKLVHCTLFLIKLNESIIECEFLNVNFNGFILSVMMIYLNKETVKLALQEEQIKSLITLSISQRLSKQVILHRHLL